MSIVYVKGNKVFLRHRSGNPVFDKMEDAVMDEEGFLWRQVGEGLNEAATQAIARLMSVQDDVAVYMTKENI